MPSVCSTKRRKKSNEQEDNNGLKLHKLCSFNTNQLKNLLFQKSFNKDTAMNLVALGANPNERGFQGNSLLHVLSKKINNFNGCNNEAMSKLVKEFDAEINIENDEGLTPYKCLLAEKFEIHEALVLLRLGANPNETLPNGDTLRDHLKNNNTNHLVLNEIDTLTKMYENNLKIPQIDFPIASPLGSINFCEFYNEKPSEFIFFKSKNEVLSSIEKRELYQANGIKAGLK